MSSQETDTHRPEPDSRRTPSGATLLSYRSRSACQPPDPKILKQPAEPERPLRTTVTPTGENRPQQTTSRSSPTGRPPLSDVPHPVSGRPHHATPVQTPSRPCNLSVGSPRAGRLPASRSPGGEENITAAWKHRQIGGLDRVRADRNRVDLFIVDAEDLKILKKRVPGSPGSLLGTAVDRRGDRPNSRRHRRDRRSRPRTWSTDEHPRGIPGNPIGSRRPGSPSVWERP